MTTTSTTDQAQSGALTMISFQEILSEIVTKRALARKDTDSWDRLEAVATQLAGAPTASGHWFRPDQVWHMERVSISNYRGIANSDPLEIIFEPTPGITVLHGLNGAGKSSISDAIELALGGTTPVVSGGTAGKAPLWDPVPLSRGSSSASVEVSLSSQGDRLVLKVALDESGEVSSHEAFLERNSECRRIDLGGDWHQALTSHQPIFAYASLERRVQLSKDLATYFESLLALGGSFTILQETITERGAASSEAFTRWRTAKDEAIGAIARIDEKRKLLGTATLLEGVREPKISENKNTWLAETGLIETGFYSDSMPSDSRARLTAAATNVRTSISDYEIAGKAANQYLSSVLEHLHAEAVDRELKDGSCPVCATTDSGWQTTLAETVKRNRHLTSLMGDVLDYARKLTTAASELIEPMLQTSGLAAKDDPIYAYSCHGGTLLKKFNDASMNGISMQHSFLTAATELCDWLCSEEAGSVVDEALKRTDATKQWRLERTQAVEAFVAVWDADGTSGAESQLWSATLKRVDELRKGLRDRRSTALEGRAGTGVQELLADAGLRLESIKVLPTKASMKLVDKTGGVVELGMLSAGQRNAVLLAPLLSSVDAGPFGFLVLDDPVHAFDELRIDRLADSLSKLAKTRRVIVLTHDDRLKEHLAARSSDYDTRLVERSSADGSVEVVESSQFWEQLLEDAHTVLNLAMSEVGTTRDVTDAIRGLCRMSIDNALRSFVLRNGVLGGRDIEADLVAIDKVHKTNDRLKTAEGFWTGANPAANPVTLAAMECQSHLLSWNQSVHGNPQLSEASSEEIRATRKACKALAAAL